MLREYIEQYKAAQERGDKKTMTRIERELNSLGMDVMTLKVLVEAESEE